MPYLDRLRELQQAQLAQLDLRAEAASESHRVCSLPRIDYTDTITPGELTAKLARPGCQYTLHPIQEAALAAIAACHGGFCPIGVGHGK